MENSEQPYDYRWHHAPRGGAAVPQPPSGAPLPPSGQTQTSRSSCMERQAWQKGYDSRSYQTNYQPHKYEARFHPKQLFDQTGKPMFDPGTKAFIDQNGKLSLFDPMDKPFPDDRQSPNVDTIIDPISNSATPSPLAQQQLPSNQAGNQIQGLHFVALPQQNRTPTQVQQQQVVLVIKDGQVVANSNQTTVAVGGNQQTVAIETLTVDTSLKDQELSLEEQLSPSLILEHAEVDDEDTDEENPDEEEEEEEDKSDEDYDPKDDFVAKSLQLFPSVKVSSIGASSEVGCEDDSSIRRSSRKRRTATYKEEFDIDLDLDNDDLESPEKNGSERKKRKSTKPVKVTPEASEEWTEAEEQDTESTLAKRRKNPMNKTKANSYSWKKTNVWFGREKMERYLKLKERCGFKSECALINRMLNLMEQSVNEVEQNKKDEEVTDYSKIGKPVSSKSKRSGRTTIHAPGDEVDEYCNVKMADTGGDDLQTNLCLRVSPEVRRNWLEMAAQSQMTTNAFVASLLLAYQKENHIDSPRYQHLLKEKQKDHPNSDNPDVCACPPTECESEDAKKKKNKKTKEVENIDDNDFIVHQVLDNNQVSTETKTTRVLKYYECSFCHKFSRNFSFFYHLRTHKPQKYDCKKCGKQMPIRQPKRSRQAAKCLYCDFHSHYRSILRNHYREAHPTQCKPGQHYLCDMCTKTFKSAATLRDHRFTHMEENYEFQCEICKKLFANRRFLRVHLHGVHGNKSHACSEGGCGRAFNTRNMLNTHVKRVHLKVRKVACPFETCSKTFFSKCELAQHTRVYHTKEKCFTCTWDGCGKSFRAPYHLQVHTRIHTDTKPLKCPHCDYRARQRNALNWHLRKHGEGPHFDKLTKPTKSRTAKPTKPASAQTQPQPETQMVSTRPMAAILDEHVGEIPMYTPQFTNFDFQNLHHPNAFHGMELYHPQMPAFPQAVPQSGTHAHAPIQYQAL